MRRRGHCGTTSVRRGRREGSIFCVALTVAKKQIRVRPSPWLLLAPPPLRSSPPPLSRHHSSLSGTCFSTSSLPRLAAGTTGSRWSCPTHTCCRREHSTAPHAAARPPCDACPRGLLLAGHVPARVRRLPKGLRARRAGRGRGRLLPAVAQAARGRRRVGERVLALRMNASGGPPSFPPEPI